MKNLPLPTFVALLDAVPDVVCFAKDRAARYTYANKTLVDRLGLPSVEALVGRTAREVFPAPLGARYFEQDMQVLQSGTSIVDELERHLFPNHAHGWCLTRKFALTSGARITGIVGISRDLRRPHTSEPTYQKLRAAIDFAKVQLEQGVTVADLARQSAVSVAQLERYFKEVFQLTPRDWLIAERLNRALHLLHGDDAIATVAQSAGFTDQSAFARAFKRHVGMSPSEFREVAVGRKN